jgi:hypothetical protein
LNRELNEALARFMAGVEDYDDRCAVLEAARWAASFPSETDVERAQEAMLKFGPMASMQGMRAALEAVALDPKERNDA